MESPIIMLSMFPDSLTVCETNPDGTCDTHTHFVEPHIVGESLTEDQLMCLGLRWYHSAYQFLQGAYANP